MNQHVAQSVKRITATEFVEEVGNSPIPVMLTFTAGGCSSCGSMLGTLETMTKVYAGRIKFLYIDTSDAGELMAHYRRGGNPLSMVMLNGKVVKSPLIQAQDNFPNEAVWLGNALYIQHFIQFLDSIMHAINTKQVEWPNG